MTHTHTRQGPQIFVTNHIIVRRSMCLLTYSCYCERRNFHCTYVHVICVSITLACIFWNRCTIFSSFRYKYNFFFLALHSQAQIPGIHYISITWCAYMFIGPGAWLSPSMRPVHAWFQTLHKIEIIPQKTLVCWYNIITMKPSFVFRVAS